MEIIINIRRREVTKSWDESLNYVTRPPNDVNICNHPLFSLLPGQLFRTEFKEQ